MVHINGVSKNSNKTNNPVISNCITIEASNRTNINANQINANRTFGNINNNNGNTAEQGPIIKTTYIPQTSLLKIEPFIPSLNTRLRRPIARSYSTLSQSSQLRRGFATDIRHNGVVLHKPLGLDAKPMLHVGNALLKSTIRGSHHASNHHGQLRRNPVRLVQRQRSKSTSSSSASATQNRTVANSASNSNTHLSPNSMSASLATNAGAIVTPQPNGICRITRLAKEQEKLPDRINYDRRGLTAIPIFENESNLRLLSLQHNLINVFHIPKDQPTQYMQPEELLTTDCSRESSPQQAQNTNSLLPNAAGSVRRQHSIANSMNPPNSKTAQNLSSSTLSLTPTKANCSHLLNRRIIATPQKPKVPAQMQRLGIQKSKSFFSKTPALQQSATAAQNSKHAHLSKMHLSFQKNLSSFDSGTSTNDSNSNSVATHEQPAAADVSDLTQDSNSSTLEIKNKQLHLSYGNIFANLVFLDLYDNQIERIANLEGLPTLSVLLLGKNRITDISGLSYVSGSLKVLDLHGNKISSISNKINCLQQLKSLNLAGNQIRQINHNDFNGLSFLKELNLKRNKIKRINGFQHLCSLERLWLCHNDIHKVEDMCSISKAENLQEITIENNPVSLAGDCVSFLVSYLPLLQSLSQMPITEQVRNAAMTWRKNKELSEAHKSPSTSKDVFNSIRREEVISNARTNWELLRSQQTVQMNLKNAQNVNQSPTARPLELEKIEESNEVVVASVTSTSLAFDELQEIIKLPPIQKANGSAVQTAKAQSDLCELGQQQQHTDDEKSKDSARNSGSSGSSLGPNVDSSSSCYSSDNEDSLHKTSNASKQNTKSGKC